MEESVIDILNNLNTTIALNVVNMDTTFPFMVFGMIILSLMFILFIFSGNFSPVKKEGDK